MLRGQPFTIFSLKDISHEKRREALERTFFHDILNTAGNILNASELMREDDDIEDRDYFLDLIYRGSEQLVDEIKSQRQLLAAEMGSLEITKQAVDPLSVIERIVAIFEKSDMATGKRITINPTVGRPTILTDTTIFGRIISNLLKSALEASFPGSGVSLTCQTHHNGWQVAVHNVTEMPRAVQLQIFQRSFSTKGLGRGIGTYSIKLFAEQYLGGKVSFESSPELGTTFYLWLPLV